MSKNIIYFPAFHTGTSLAQMRDSIKYLINKYNWDLEVIDKYEIIDKSDTEYFDSTDEVKIYPKIISEILDLNPSKLLLMDFFFPGLDTILYFREVAKTDLKIGAVMLGASFLPGDLYRWDWLAEDEKFWFHAYDSLFVGSKFFKNLIPKKYRKNVTPNYLGLDGVNYFNSPAKDLDVVFAHRLSSDKGIEDLIYIIQKLPEVKFYITSFEEQPENNYYKKLKALKNVSFVLGETEEEHLKTLSRARISLSCATQETYGYSMAKSVMSGCIPIVPNREVYPELYPKSTIYKDLDDAVLKIREITNGSTDLVPTKDLDKMKKEFTKHSFEPMLRKFFNV